jgi:hypothetical protein
MSTFNSIDNNGIQMTLDNTNKSVSIDPDNGIVIKYDLLTANPKQFTISNTGMNFLDNTENNTTFLSRIALLQQALASVEIPPNPTTFEVVSSVLVRDTGTNSIALDGVVPSVIITDGTDTNTITINSIDATGGLTLPSVVSFTNAVAPTCLANPQGSTDLCNKQYVDSQSALTAYQLYFNYSVPYTVPSGSTYQTLSSTQIATPTTVGWTTNSLSPVFLGGFFNLLSTLNITSITAGVWTLLLFANLTSIAGQGREAFFYTIIGTASSGAETILYTSPASLLLNTVTPLVGSVSIQGTIPLISLTGYTGLGIKLYIQSNTGSVTTGSVIYQTPNEYSSILTSVLPISAVSNLSLVLTAGNSAGSSSINMNNNNISGILQASGQAVVLTNTTANTTLSVNSSSATTTTLLTKFNNGRTAQTGETIRLDFNAKNSAGTEFNYGKIHMNTPAIGAGVERGRLDLDVRDSVGLSTYLGCNGNTLQVDCFRELHMNTRNIIGIVNANTANSSQLAPQKVDFLTANGTVPSTSLDLNQRYVCANAGKLQTWIDSGVQNFNGVSAEDATASCVFYFAWWVGTSGGNLYYSIDNGATWTFKYYFGGPINCLTEYNGGNNMAIGGNFGGYGLANLAGVDTGFSVIDITPSYQGVNAEVKCLFNNSANSCLMVGGSFTDFNGGSGGAYYTNALFTLEYSSNTWYNALNVNSFSNGGFVDSMSNAGIVYSIARDNTNSFIIVGGDFYQVNTNSGPQSSSNLFVFQTFNGYDTAGFYPYGINPINAPVKAVLDYNTFGAGILVGGDFTGAGGGFISYGMLMVWNSGTSNWDLSSYPLGGGGGNPITFITQPASGGTIFTYYGGSNLYNQNALLPALPIGSAWKCVAFSYPASTIYYATDAQSSVGFPFYIVDTSTQVSLTSVYPIKQYSTLSHTNIQLAGTGSIAELIWNANLSEWYIISSYGAVFT